MYSVLNLFPSLLWLEIFAPFFLRAALGGILLLTGIRHIKRRHHTAGSQSLTKQLLVVGCIESIIGFLFLIGLYTQGAALAGLLYSLAALFLPKVRMLCGRDRAFILLMGAVSAALLVTGAGPFAMDLPF